MTSLTYRGITRTIGDWAKHLSVPTIVLHTAMQQGMSDADVISLVRQYEKADVSNPEAQFKLPPEKPAYTNYRVFDVANKMWLTGRRVSPHTSMP